MDEQIEDIFPMDKEDKDLASFTSRLRRRTPNGSNRHKSRPISYPPCFSFDLPQPSFLKGRLMDRKPQKLIDPIPKEIALKAGRKVKFADEAGKQLVSYLEIPNKFERFGFRSLTNISSAFDKAMEDTFESESFDDPFETAEEIFDDVFNTSFDRPKFNIDNESSEMSNSPGQKRKYGLKGQKFPKERCSKEMLFSEQRRMSDSTSRKKQINELSSPHVKLRKYSLEEWIITESDEENNCDILTKPTTFHKQDTKKDSTQPFYHKPFDHRKPQSMLESSDNTKKQDFRKSLSILDIEEENCNYSNTSYQDDDLPQTKTENKWINIPVVILEENKENGKPKSKFCNKNSSSSDSKIPVSNVPVIDETEAKYKELCRKLYSAGQDKSSLNTTILNTEEAIKETQCTFTSQEVVEEVNFTLVINDLNNKPDIHDMEDTNIDISYTYCPVISAVDNRKEAISESENVMTSSFDENPNISFTIIAPSTSNIDCNSDSSTFSDNNSVAQPTEMSEEKNSDLTSQSDIDMTLAKGEAVQFTTEKDFLSTTESAIQDILNIFDTVTFPEENVFESVETNTCSKSSSSSLEDSQIENRYVAHINHDNEDINNTVKLSSSNSDNNDTYKVDGDIATPCIQVSNHSSDTDLCQSDFISGNEVHTSINDHHINSQSTNETDKHLVCVTEIYDDHDHNLSQNEPEKHLLCVGDNMSELNDDMHSIYHESESGYVTYSHQDSVETMRDLDFDEDSDNSSYSYETSIIETDNETKADTNLAAKCQLPQNVGIHITEKNHCDSDATYNPELKNEIQNASKNLIDVEENNIHPVEKNNVSSQEGSYSDSCSESEESSSDEISKQNYNLKTKTFDGKEANVFNSKHHGINNNNIDNDESSTTSSKNEECSSSDDSSSSNNNDNIIRENNEIFNQGNSCVSPLSSKTNSVADFYKFDASSLKNSANVDKYSADSYAMSQEREDKTLSECNTIETDICKTSSHEDISFDCNDILAGNNTVSSVLNNRVDKNHDIFKHISEINENMCGEIEPCDRQITYQDETQLHTNETQLENLSFSVIKKDGNLLKTTNLHDNPSDKQVIGEIPYIHAIVQTNAIEHISITIDCEQDKYSVKHVEDQQFATNSSFKIERVKTKCENDQVLYTQKEISKIIPAETTVTNLSSFEMYHSNETEESKVNEKLKTTNSQENKPNNTKNRHKHKLARSNTFSSSDSENSDASLQYKKHKRTKRTKKSLKLSKDAQILTGCNKSKDGVQSKLPLSNCILEEDLGNESDVESILNDSNIGDSFTSSSSSFQGELCLSKDIQNVDNCAINSIRCPGNISDIATNEIKDMHENTLTDGIEQQAVLDGDTVRSFIEGVSNIVLNENPLLQLKLTETNQAHSNSLQLNANISGTTSTENSESSDEISSGTDLNDSKVNACSSMACTSSNVSNIHSKENNSRSDFNCANFIKRSLGSSSENVKVTKSEANTSQSISSDSNNTDCSINDGQPNRNCSPEGSCCGTSKISSECAITKQNDTDSTVSNTTQSGASDNGLVVVSGNCNAAHDAIKVSKQESISDSEDESDQEPDSNSSSESKPKTKPYGKKTSKTSSDNSESECDRSHVSKIEGNSYDKEESHKGVIDKLINKGNASNKIDTQTTNSDNSDSSCNSCKESDSSSSKMSGNSHENHRNKSKSSSHRNADYSSDSLDHNDSKLGSHANSDDNVSSQETISDKSEKAKSSNNETESSSSSSIASSSDTDDTSSDETDDNDDAKHKEDTKLLSKPKTISSDRSELVKSLSLSHSSESDKEIFGGIEGKCGSKIDDVSVTVTITCDGQLIVKDDDTCDAFRN